MLKPVCVPCERFMRMQKSGYYFIEGMPLGNDAKPGLAEIARWKDYKLWSGDLWKCPDCGASVISGVGYSPIAEHYQEDFGRKKEILAPTLLVKDC